MKILDLTSKKGKTKRAEKQAITNGCSKFIESLKLKGFHEIKYITSINVSCELEESKIPDLKFGPSLISAKLPRVYISNVEISTLGWEHTYEFNNMSTQEFELSGFSTTRFNNLQTHTNPPKDLPISEEVILVTKPKDGSAEMKFFVKFGASRAELRMMGYST